MIERTVTLLFVIYINIILISIFVINMVERTVIIVFVIYMNDIVCPWNSVVFK